MDYLIEFYDKIQYKKLNTSDDYLVDMYLYAKTNELVHKKYGRVAFSYFVVTKQNKESKTEILVNALIKEPYYYMQTDLKEFLCNEIIQNEIECYIAKQLELGSI